ncbi:transposase [Ruminococcus sp. OM04-4AA]|nr:transposase [Ruminococcus sp. OM04-4AA]
MHRLAEYEAIQKLSSTKHYPIDRLCKYLNVTRSAYYRWVKYPKSNNELRNERLSTEIQRIHNQHPDMGYRRIRDELDGHKGIHVNDKRVLRICRKYDINQILNGNLRVVPEETEILIT